jgi:hypothetical protein
VMNRRTGFMAGAALAAGLAIGFAGTALAANPTASPGYPSMMGGGGFGPGMMGGGGFGPGSSYGPGMMGGSFGPGMMGGASFAPGSSFGPDMMRGLSQAQLQALFERCDEIRDAMHAALNAAASASTSPAPR